MNYATLLLADTILGCQNICTIIFMHMPFFRFSSGNKVKCKITVFLKEKELTVFLEEKGK